MNLSQSLPKRPNSAVLAALIAAVLAGTSNAQSQDTTRENANRPPAARQETQIARSDTGMRTLEQHLQDNTLRVSKLVGMEVQNRGGDNVGEVHDVLHDATPGKDLQLIVSTGGLGADQKLVAVPLDEIQINAAGDELYTNRSREQLAASTPVTLDSRSAAPQPGAAGQRAATPSSQQRIGDLVDAEVVGSAGDKVGEVEDIVISTAGADSIRAVLQVGGVAGIGEKRISVPLSQLAIERADGNEPTLRIAMDSAALERMPEFKYEEQTEAL